MKQANDPAGLPQFELSQLDGDSAAQVFQKSGCLQILDFLDPVQIRELSSALRQDHDASENDSDFIRVGDKRRMISVPIQGVFNNAQIDSSPFLSGFLNTQLADNHVINCFSCVVSRPGAKPQHTHTDYQGLFNSPLDALSPSFAINLFVPLVELNDVNGTTQMWPGTHRKPLSDPEANTGICPTVPLGSAIVMDYRLQHRGTANLSSDIRPILTLGYSRNWFLDNRNFASMSPLKLDRETYETMPPARQRLFERAKLYF